MKSPITKKLIELVPECSVIDLCLDNRNIDREEGCWKESVEFERWKPIVLFFFIIFIVKGDGVRDLRSVSLKNLIPQKFQRNLCALEIASQILNFDSYSEIKKFKQCFFRHASEEIQNDIEVVAKAVEKKCICFSFCFMRTNRKKTDLEACKQKEVMLWSLNSKN